jgi:hypothetical protein
MSAEPTRQIEKSKGNRPENREDPIFEPAVKRLKSAHDVSDEDKQCILRLDKVRIIRTLNGAFTEFPIS